MKAPGHSRIAVILSFAIAREIIRDHSGEQRVLGSGADGTVMRLELPLARE